MALDMIVQRDADVAPPTDVTITTYGASTTGASGVFVYALAATTASFIIPSAWRGKYVAFQCDGGTGFYMTMGPSTQECVIATASTVATRAITFVTKSCWKVEAGTTFQCRIPQDTTVVDFAIIGASAAGYCRAFLSTGPGVL